MNTKPACIPPEINNTCVDPTPDGVTCFSYSNCLNVRSGTYYNNADTCDPGNFNYNRSGCEGKVVTGVQTLPKVGSEINIFLPIMFVVIALMLRYIIKKHILNT